MGCGHFDIDSPPLKILFPVKHALVLNFATPLSVLKHSELLGISQCPLFNI